MTSEIRTIEMGLVNTSEAKGEFTFEMQPKSNTARTVRFSIDQVDAKALYEAIGKYLNGRDKQA
jgi:hypothetical protein